MASSPAESGADADEVVDGELVEDAIDGVRADADSGDGDEAGQIAEADPESATSGDATSGDDEVDAKARRLMQESGFSVDDELTVPDDWSEQDNEMAGFQLEVQRGDEKITLSHEDLEPWVHDQLYALLRDDHVDEAATLLADHSPLTTEEAHKFLMVFKDQS